MAIVYFTQNGSAKADFIVTAPHDTLFLFPNECFWFVPGTVDPNE
jgi:hypothetical protein